LYNTNKFPSEFAVWFLQYNTIHHHHHHTYMELVLPLAWSRRGRNLLPTSFPHANWGAPEEGVGRGRGWKGRAFTHPCANLVNIVYFYFYFGQLLFRKQQTRQKRADRWRKWLR
jgi:hypothetical protein